MSEPKKDVVVKALDTAWDQLVPELLDILKGTKTFVLEQTPIVLQELITVGIIDASVSAFVSLAWAALFVLCAYLMGKKLISYKGTLEKPGDGSDFLEVVITANYLAGAVLFFWNMRSAIYNATKAFKVYFAPRVYLIEYLSDMVNK